MASTRQDIELPYRESVGSKPLRPGGAEPDAMPELDPGFNWLFVGLGVVLAIGIVIGFWQMGEAPAAHRQIDYNAIVPPPR